MIFIQILMDCGKLDKNARIYLGRSMVILLLVFIENIFKILIL